MKMNRARSVEEFQQVGRFNRLREKLAGARYAERRGRPISFWALPNDRRLPFALLDRSVDDLVAKNYGDLAATPGVGAKKIATLLTLLERATKDDPPGGSAPTVAESVNGKRSNSRESLSGEAEVFNPGEVSEALWTEWKQAIRAHGLQDLKIGRVAPTLANLPTVLWNVRLSFYLELTAAEVQQLKTHGAKRVRAVFEIFHGVCGLLSEAGEGLPIRARPRPAFIDGPETYLLGALEEAEPLDAAAVRRNVCRPLADQIRLDLGDAVGDLAENRLQLSGDLIPVKDHAKRLKVTRARVYQLLDYCADAMAVRWPEGRPLFVACRSRLEDPAERGPARDLMLAAADLAFPQRKASAAKRSLQTVA